MAVQAAPPPLGGLSQLEHHGQARAAATAPLRFAMPQPDGGERRLDRIGRPQVFPVLGWEVVKAEQHVTIFFQTSAGGVVLGLILFEEGVESPVGVLASFRHPDLVQVGFGSRLHTLGHVVQHVPRLVNPAALLARLREHLTESCPES